MWCNKREEDLIMVGCKVTLNLIVFLKQEDAQIIFDVGYR